MREGNVGFFANNYKFISIYLLSRVNELYFLNFYWFTSSLRFERVREGM